MSRAIAYLRCSTQEQAESQLGIEAQLQSVRALALRLNIEIVAVHTDDGISGSAPVEARPGLLAAIDALRQGDLLLCARRDRLARDIVVAALVERLVARKQAKIASTDAPDDDGSPSATMMRQILDVFASYERLVIKARTKTALAAKKRRGERAGHLAWGTTLAPDGRTVVPNGHELAILEEIRRLRHRGLCIVDICAELTAKGMLNRKNQPFKPSAVAQLLERHGDGLPRSA
jgi:site-specific DNA recombinase